MILERIAIDFRCNGCQMIRRTDADLGKTIADQLPTGWLLEGIGVTCPRCAGAPAEPTRKERADARRENIRKMTAEVTSLESPITAAATPLVSDKCTRCQAEIGEMESWRPDPMATGFAKAHRQCLIDSLMKGAP